MKFPLKCRTKKLGMIYTILGSFCSFLNWEGADYCPKSGLGKSLYKLSDIIDSSFKINLFLYRVTLLVMFFCLFCILLCSGRMMWQGPHVKYRRPEDRKYSMWIKDSKDNHFLRERGMRCLADHEIGTHFVSL